MLSVKAPDTDQRDGFSLMDSEDLKNPKNRISLLQCLMSLNAIPMYT